MSIFDELFNPSARFREDEKNRLEWMRDEEGEGDPHRGPIDLDSGAVQIRVSGVQIQVASAGAGGAAGAGEVVEITEAAKDPEDGESSR